MVCSSLLLSSGTHARLLWKLTVLFQLGESIPPTREGILKFNYEVSFTNMVHHKESNQTISVPPTPLGQNTWSQDVPEGLKSEVRQVLPHVYGQDPQGLKIQSYRMCW